MFTLLERAGVGTRVHRMIASRDEAVSWIEERARVWGQPVRDVFGDGSQFAVDTSDVQYLAASLDDAK